MGRAIELREYPSERPTPSHQRKAAWQRPHRVSRVAATLPESRSSARSHMSSAREPGDLGGARRVMVTSEHPREGKCLTPGPRANEESDALIVPEKSAKTWVTPVESMEGRGAAKEKLASGNARRMQGRGSAPTEARRAGSKDKPRVKGGKYTNLFCHLKVVQLREAYLRLRQRHQLAWTA